MAKSAARRKHMFLAACITCFISVVLNSSIIWAHIYALSPGGSTFLLNGTFILMLPMVIALFLAVLGLLGLFVNSIRPFIVFVIICSFSYLVTSIATLSVSGYIIHSIRNTAFEELAERSGPLINAIRSYEQTYGIPPDDLQQLVPEFISEIPQTGMGGSPDYHYLSGEDALRWGGNPWVIFMKTPTGPLDCDTFMYLPLQNYPKKGYGGTLERIDDWAYVHES